MASTVAQAPAGSETRIRPLWRNVQFQVLWIGQSASSLGMAVADVAYPLAILALTGSAGRAGLFASVQAAGALAAGLPGGQLADRCDWRRIVIAAEAVRALVTAGIVAALLLSVLSLPVLLASAVLLGTSQGIVSTARFLLVRAAVPASQLTAALTQDEIRQNGASLIGPPVGGALYGLRALAHAAPFVFTAASFVISLITALMIKVGRDQADAGKRAPHAAQSAAGDQAAGEQAAGDPAAGERAAGDPAAGERAAGEQGLDGEAGASRRRVMSGMLQGLATLWRQPVLRAAMVLIMMVNTVGAGLDIIVVVILRQQSVSPGLIGVALGGGAIGGLAGAPLVPLLHKLRPGILLLGVCVWFLPPLALLAVPAGPWWAAMLLFAAMLGVPAVRVLIDVLVLRQSPAEQRGRVLGAVQTLLGLGMPVGLAASGVLLQVLPAGTAMLILAGVLAASVLSCALVPALRQARWPA